MPSAVAFFIHKQWGSIMSKYVRSAADALPEDRVPGLNPAGSAYSSAPAGIFSLRRAHYFNKPGVVTRCAGIVEAPKEGTVEPHGEAPREALQADYISQSR
jgi:hypothetical protein